MKVFFLLFAFSIFLWEFLAKSPDQFLHITVCDVGQGDAILLSLGYSQVLIDTGPDESVLSCLNKHMPFLDKKIDVLVLTHFDDDHIGGFDQLTQVYAINYLFLPLNTYKDSESFLKLKERIISIEKLGTIVKEPFLGQQIAFSEFSPSHQAKYNSTESSLLLSFLTPSDLDLEEYLALERAKSFLWQKSEDELSAEELQNMGIKTSDNDGSIGIFAQFGELKLLLLGDLETTREVALIESGLITKVDIQKIGHHGSKTSSSSEFLLRSRPEISLISCGLNNQFGHPNAEVLSNLQSIGSQVLRTDKMGTIEVLSDGQKFWLKNEKQNLF
jgi:competence protein ComEC